MLRIGPHVVDPPFLLAPMASVSEMPFRVLALSFGAGLATTELISASGIFYRNRRTRQYMTFDRVREAPYSIQLFGGDPKVMAHAAAAAVEHGAGIVDVNMGCPVRKVTTTGSGSALLCDPKRAAAMVREMRVAVDDKVPITVKIRSGWDDHSKNFVEMAKGLEDAGCAALAMHARTRAQGYAGRADWSLIGALKRATSMPIIGNGDVTSVADAQRMLAETGCDAVMIGRGALGNPWIFRGLREGRELVPSPAERLAVIEEHLEAHIAFHELLDDEETRRTLRTPPAHMAVRTFRQHLVWYSRGLRGGKEFRRAVLTLDEPEAVKEQIALFFGAADVDARSDDVADEGVSYQQAFG
jgi:nifR3 family TIM-barrel protein